MKALGGCHASVHIHPEGRFEQGRSNGGDIRRGHPVFSVSRLGFLLEDAGLCVYHTTVLSLTNAPPLPPTPASPVVCCYLDRTNHTKRLLSHLDLEGWLW